MRVLVCGGRDFDKRSIVFGALDAIHRVTPVTLVATGGARGADWLAEQWADVNRVPLIVMEADWGTYGKKAGPVRNEALLRATKPDLVLHAPGGRGTADMLRRAKAAGVETRQMVGSVPPRIEADAVKELEGHEA